MNYMGLALSDLGSLRALTRMGSEVCALPCGEVARCREVDVRAGAWLFAVASGVAAGRVQSACASEQRHPCMSLFTSACRRRPPRRRRPHRPVAYSSRKIKRKIRVRETLSF